jgi:signal transduction histidine kinase
MLQNWPIRSKLAAILVVPLLTLSVLSAFQVRDNLSHVAESNRVRDLATFSIKVNDLIAALQDERNAVASYVGGRYQPGQSSQAVSVRKPVTTALATYQAAVARLSGGTRSRLGSVQSTVSAQLAKLPGVRGQIDAKTAQNLPTSSYYTATIGDLLSLDAQISAGSNYADLVNGAAALTSVAQVKEAVNQQLGYTAEIIFLHQNSPSTISLVETATGAEQAWLTQFQNTATPEQRALYTQTLGVSDRNMANLRDRALTSAQQAGGQIAFSPLDWLTVGNTKIKNLRAVELGLSHDLQHRSSALASSATQRALSSGLITLLVLVASVGISLLVASPMIRQLRRLRGGALEVANERLPTLVERLHQGKPVDPQAEIFPVTIRSKDEIGQVAAAFATVHQVAVRTAVEQAAMRKSIGDTFLNLARRSQSLVHRQLKVIDKLERKETDPDELEELFRLDHLATRMRRHAEDLIVLSGSKPARGWRRPVAIKDVVRGAVAEVEDYTRVKVMPVTGAPVSGHAVGDVIHLLAELVENATSFSPPHTPVHISGHEVSNGCVVEIEDRGLGMTEEEFTSINHRLANPPPFDLSTSERLGLFVVGRLAERHKIRVRLRPSPYGGTLAIVLLPSALLRLSDPDFIGSDDATGESTDALLEDAEVYSSSPAPATSERELDRPLTDDLPVFATVRSSWFVNDRGGVNGNGSSGPSGSSGSLGSSGSSGSSGGMGSGSTAGWGRSDVPDRPALGPGSSFDPGRSAAGGPPFGRGQSDAVDQASSYGPGPAFGGSPFDGGSRFDGGSPFDGESPYGGGPPFENGQSFDVDGLPSFDEGPASERAPRGTPTPDPSRHLPGPSASYSRQDFPERPPAPQETTEVGLPKRNRRASLAPELRGGAPKPALDAGDGDGSAHGPMLAGSRSPDEIRAMMSSFQSNFGRGLQDGSYTFDDDEIRE